MSEERSDSGFASGCSGAWACISRSARPVSKITSISSSPINFGTRLGQKSYCISSNFLPSSRLRILVSSATKL